MSGARVLAFGTYEADCPSNRMALLALRAAGARVRECRVPLWERRRHKTGRALSPLALGLWGARYAAAARQLGRRIATEQLDCLLVGYPGHLDMALARRWAAGRRIVFCPLVSLHDTLVGDRRRFGERGPAARALGRLDRMAFAAADLVVSDTAAHAALYRERLGVPRERLAVIPIGAEPIFRPLAGVAPPAGRLRVLFYGKLSPVHGLDAVLGAARRLERERVTLRLIGSGQLGGWLERELRGLRPGNVERLDWVDYRRLPGELCSAHVALGIFGGGPKAGRVIPNKAYQALACGRPLITADTPAARELLRDGETALLVPPGDGEALAEAILRLRDEDLRERIGAAGRALFAERLDVGALAPRWAAAVGNSGPRDEPVVTPAAHV